MDSNIELVDYSSYTKEDKMIPKIEPIEEDFIKIEESEENNCLVSGKDESLKIDTDSIEEEIFENKDVESCSSSNVRSLFFRVIYYMVLSNLIYILI